MSQEGETAALPRGEQGSGAVRAIGLETSTFVGGVALVEGDRVVSEWTFDGGPGGHSRWLLAALDRLLAQAGWDRRSIGCVAVNRGPGSFTGLRVGLATAQGLSLGWGSPVIGVDGLEALAWQAAASGQAREPRPGTVVLSMIDARHGNLYGAAYRWGEAGVETLVAPGAWAAEDFFHAVRQTGAVPGSPGLPPVLAGDGGIVFESLAKRLLGPVQPVPLDGERLRAATVARWALRYGRGRGAGGRGISPLYLKASEAERKWGSKGR